MCSIAVIKKVKLIYYILDFWDPVAIAEKAKSPLKDYCYGYQNIDTAGKYISTMKLEIGVEKIDHLVGDEILLKIAAYDKAEANGTYIGQINMIGVSSFSGPGAAVWGYDLVPPVDLKERLLFHIHENEHDMFKQIPKSPPKIPVYSVKPLLIASQSLYGTVEHEKRRFPILAGAHVPCAVKEAYSFDPKTKQPAAGWLWSFISLAIAENRHRDACLFVEDCGFYPDEEHTDTSIEKIHEKLDAKLKNVTYCQYLCGINQKAPYKEIFAGYVCEYVAKHQIGCALTCAPYVSLAQGAYPNQDAKNLKDMSLAEWESCVFTSHK